MLWFHDSILSPAQRQSASENQAERNAQYNHLIYQTKSKLEALEK
jgi:hypothetical protein